MVCKNVKIMKKKVEIKAISAQPNEVGVGLSWAELGNKIAESGHTRIISH